MDSFSGQFALNFGFSFEDLYDRRALPRLDQAFLDELKAADAPLHDRLVAARLDPDSLPRKAQSDLIVEVAPHLEDFIGRLFGISDEIGQLQARHNELAPLFAVKRNFVQRKALTGVTKEQAAAIDASAVRSQLEQLFGEPLTERSFAAHVDHWLKAEDRHKPELELAATYSAWATLSPEGQARPKNGLLFKTHH